MRFGSRKPRMRRSRSRVGWWLFSARLAAQLIGDDPARCRAETQDALKEVFGRGLVAPLLQQHVEFGAMLIDRPP
ncbi:hypothetical protein N234_28795 [Ralstonia pickettii DTP0602]|nr:hypothetical protein N234_28795 [Ralstonia pickettii DTP0602]